MDFQKLFCQFCVILFLKLQLSFPLFSSFAVVITQWSDAVRMRRPDSDRYVMVDGNISLYCDFDLEGEELYTLMWFKGNSLLMRYKPKAPEHPLPAAFELQAGNYQFLGRNSAHDNAWICYHRE